MSAAICAAALAILCWDNVGYILEWRDIVTGISEQKLYRTGQECSDDRRARVAKLDPRRTAMGACDSQVWLPWEQATPPERIVGPGPWGIRVYP